MKTIITLLLFSFTGMCTSQQKISFDKIHYTAHSRGVLKEITITQDSLIYKSLNDTKKYSLNKDERSKIQLLFMNLKVEEIHLLKPKSNHNITDRALIASLEIYVKKKSYKSLDFDHLNPPEKLKPIVDYILTLTHKKSE